MKKTVSIIILAVMLVSMLGIAASAADEAKSVIVTVCDGKGIAVVNEKIAIEEGKTDTLNDVFKAVNEKHGKTFATVNSDYGLSITCFWSIEHGGASGYYVNDQMAMGLTDVVKNGDRVVAFVYSDATGFSDSYSYFDIKETNVKKGEAVTLTLSRLGFDENWNTVVLPVADATVTIDGTAVDGKTDANGKITFTPAKSGVVSASSETVTLVPPVCVVTVSNPFPTVAVIIIACVVVIAIAAVIIVNKKKK